jgi:hypothetical protein
VNEHIAAATASTADTANQRGTPRNPLSPWSDARIIQQQLARELQLEGSEKIANCDDPNLAKGIQEQQVTIAGYDPFRSRFDCTFQHAVVIWICAVRQVARGFQPPGH